jgi:hypothetical protein
MTKKYELIDCIDNLVNYIHVNKELDSIKGANLDYVLIMLKNLRIKVDNIESLGVKDGNF